MKVKTFFWCKRINFLCTMIRLQICPSDIKLKFHANDNNQFHFLKSFGNSAFINVPRYLIIIKN